MNDEVNMPHHKIFRIHWQNPVCIKEEGGKIKKKMVSQGMRAFLTISPQFTTLQVKILPSPKLANYPSVTTCPGLDRSLPVLRTRLQF